MTKPKTVDRATAYANAAVDGKIIAGPHVRNACRRHIADLKRKDIKFDKEAAAKARGYQQVRHARAGPGRHPFRSR
ncbi:MAG: terminase large subunit [Mucilaginibacter sp.]|nr:terminase large subunit [Mucilaginibacter sp.]